MSRPLSLSAVIAVAALIAGAPTALAAPQPGPVLEFSCGTALHPPGIFHTPGAPDSVWLDGEHYVMVSLDAPWIHQTFGTKIGLSDELITCTDGIVTAVIAPTP